MNNYLLLVASMFSIAAGGAIYTLVVKDKTPMERFITLAFLVLYCTMAGYACYYVAGGK